MKTCLSDMNAGDFEPHSGESFRLVAAGGELELKLVEVRRLGQALRAWGAFSLTFVSPPGPVLPQAIYALDHPALGSLAIFLVPLARTPDGVTYEAIFT
jgi:hypothetical protein